MKIVRIFGSYTFDGTFLRILGSYTFDREKIIRIFGSETFPFPSLPSLTFDRKKSIRIFGSETFRGKFFYGSYTSCDKLMDIFGC